MAQRLDEIHEFGLDIKNRRIFLFGELESHTDNSKLNYTLGDQVIKNLLLLDETYGKIELWIKTDGGNVDDMFAVCDIIEHLENQVVTVGIGAVCSAGVMVLASGSQRKVFKNCIFMDHDMSGDYEGSGLGLNSYNRLAQKQRKIIANFLSKHSKKTESWWSNRIKGEHWTDAQGMIDLGLVDGFY